jgi:GNAT superfamily N-acetyltransferase
VLVQTGAVHSLVSDVAARRDLPPVELADSPTDAWLAMVSAHKGRLPAAARHILTGVPEVVFASVQDENGDLLGVARGAVTGPAPGRWLGVSLVQTAPAARRRGLGRHVMRAVAQWATQRGAVRAYLQVEERNTAAVALYQGLGFRTHHTYLTREAPL